MMQILKMAMTTGTVLKKTDSAKREIDSQFIANQFVDLENSIYDFAVRNTIYILSHLKTILVATYDWPPHLM